MPDIDPAALSRQDSTTNATATPSLSSKSLSINPPSSSKAGKAIQSTPRVDIEPLYTALKNAIGDSWGTYKNAISQFVLGELSPDELSRHIEHFIGVDAQREHLHNQLICGIYANLCRDPPENGIAPWVSANDKPTSVTKPATGDGAEQRLKDEVKALPPRARHRLKQIQDEPSQPLTHAYISQRESRHPLSSTTTNTTSSLAASSTPSATTPSTGLNKDLEIRKRYNALLVSETRDLPPTSTLTDRLLPICYEEGLSSGPTNPAMCAELLSTALENFIKETLGAMMSRCTTDAPISAPTGVIAPSSSERNAAVTIPVPEGESAELLAGAAESQAVPKTEVTTNGVDIATSTNGDGTASPPPVQNTTQTPQHATNPLTLGHGLAQVTPLGVLTANFRRQLAREDALCAKGLLKRTDAGLLPCEVAAAKRAGRVGTTTGAEDWKLSWEMGDVWLKNMIPWMSERVCAGEFAGVGREDNADGEDAFDEVDAEDIVMKDAAPSSAGLTNGMANGDTSTNGLGLMLPPSDDLMAVDDSDWGWQGATKVDRGALTGLLDDCLAVGQ